MPLQPATVEDLRTLLDAGYSNEQIAGRIGCSETTIRMCVKQGRTPTRVIGLAIRRAFPKQLATSG